jgi:hypothetical protein
LLTGNSFFSQNSYVRQFTYLVASRPALRSKGFGKVAGVFPDCNSHAGACIGANTAIFSVVNGVLLNPLPFHDPNQLVSLFQEIPNFKNGSISYPNFTDWRRMNTTFAGMAAYRSAGFNLSGSGEPERLHGEMISAGFFEILGVNPIMGRTFTADEDRLGANPTVMITEGLWKRKFGSRTDISARGSAA